MPTHSSPKDRLIIALDVASEAEALGIVSELKDAVGMFKVGHQLFTAYGPEIVRKIINMGSRVFLDLKYHDIPNTVARAVEEAVKLGVDILNVHALGGVDMMKAAAAIKESASKAGRQPPLVLAVTILTSIDRRILQRELKVSRPIRRMVCHLARLADRAGLDGVVASPQEIKTLRRAIRSRFIILTPGVRPSWADPDDQKRIMTPAEAVSSGADYIVIGRPVLMASDRRMAVERVLDEIRMGTTEGGIKLTDGGRCG